MIKQVILIAIFGLTSAFYLAGQVVVDNEASELEILGTSTIHDWEIVAEEVGGKADVKSGDKLVINELDFWVNVKSLESGKGAMNSNTYEALKADKYPKIKYTLKNIVSQSKTSTGYTLETTGDLMIAGSTKTMKIPVVATQKGQGMAFEGEITFNMTDFGIDPPTAVFGTIKTGNEVTIKFNVQYQN